MPQGSPSSLAYERTIADLRSTNAELIAINAELRAAHELLASKEGDLQAMLSVMDGMVWSVDSDMRYRSMNTPLRKQMEERHGMEPRIGDLVWEVMKDLDQTAEDFWRPHYTKALKGEKVSFLYDLPRSARTRSWEYVFNPIVADERVIGVSCFAIDITERLEALRVLEASEKRFRALMEHSSDMLTIRNAEGDVLYENPSKRRMLGYTEDDPDMPPGFEVVHPDDLARMHAAFDLALGSPGTPIHHRRRMLRKDGSIIHTSGTTTNLLHVPEVGGLVSNIRDISDLVEAHGRISDSEALLAQAQQIGRIGSWKNTLQGTSADPDGEVIWSDEMYRLLGGGPGDRSPSRSTFMEAVHPDDRVHVHANLLHALTVTGPTSYDHRVLLPDGQVRWLHQETMTVFDDAGVAVHALGTMQDITEAHEAQERLHSSEERFRALIEGNADGILLSDQDMKVVYSSPSVERLLGFTALEMQERTSADLVLEEHHARVAQAFQRVLERPGRMERLQLELVHKDGTHRWVDALLSNMLDVPSVKAVVVNFRDITEAVELNEQVVFDRNNLYALINSTQDMLFSVDPGYRLITANRATVDAFRTAIGFRIKPGDALGLPDVPGSSRSDVWYGHFQRALAGEHFRVEEHHTLPRVAVSEMNYAPIMDRDSIVGVAVLGRDITAERKAQMQLVQLNASLETRVVERTKELTRVNEELQASTVRNLRLGNEVAARSAELMASITYASNIQRALIPERSKFDHFHDMGLMIRPRNTVSGDLLWCHSTSEHFIMAVADCTGHGVPGAMMSMLGHDLLNHIVMENGVRAPHLILEQMDAAVQRLFQRNEGETLTDGMDIAMVFIDKTTMGLSYAGAMIPLMIIRDGQAMHTAAARLTIGGRRTQERKVFTRTLHQLEPGDRLCLFTDGFGDQFGGARNKKLLRRRFVDLLLRQCPKDPGARVAASQAAIELDEYFLAWKGTEEQVDDVLVLLLDV